MAAPLDMRAMMQEELRRHKAAQKASQTGQSTYDNGSGGGSQEKEDNESGTQVSTSTQIVEHPRYQLPPRGFTKAPEEVGAVWERYKITRFPCNEEQHGEFSNQQLPGTLAYVPDFVSVEEEVKLTESIHSSSYKEKWVHLKHRRLQNWGGHPTSGGLTDREQLPQWLESVIDTLVEIELFRGNVRPNHVLINQYLPGEGKSLSRLCLHLNADNDTIHVNDGYSRDPSPYGRTYILSCSSHTIP
eukprot:gb/GECG01015798.1/.p1 GENE.gb/GECG01015798.1/~~gb/GECG01015798.1/.p1  ORF type:complete len:244 (+),score=30.80 gb/GECG01015798.1/:1-732(+)